MHIAIIDPDAKIVPRDRALMQLAHKHLISREPLPQTLNTGSGAVDTVQYLGTFERDARPSSQVVQIEFVGIPQPTVAELAGAMRAAVLAAVKPASKADRRDLMLTRLVSAHARGEPLPTTVTLDGGALDTASFLAGFANDRRVAWSALAHYAEHVQSPTVGECIAPLMQ